MFKRNFCATALALLVCAQCFGDIGQNQGYELQLGAMTNLFTGVGTTNSGDIAVACMGQTAIREVGLWALQDDNVILTESTGGIGQGALLGALQTSSAVGMQNQFVGNVCAGGAEGRSLAVDLSQGLTKAAGPGVIGASSEFIGASLQALGSLCATMNADQLVTARQGSAIDGGACSVAATTTAVEASIAQTQAAN
jgi:hypothetical protein